MKKIGAVFLALMIVSGSLFAAPKAASGKKYKIGILAPAVTHGWVAAVAYEAEARCPIKSCISSTRVPTAKR